MADSTRRNQHIILRAVLKSVGPKGAKWITLSEYPTLPKVGESPIATVSLEELHRLLNEGRAKYCQAKAVHAAQLAMAVAAYAGLRAGEVRALRRRDVDLERGVLTVRVARTAGEESTPKSKHSRPVPIAAPLLERLKVRCDGLKPDDHVCVMASGKPWGDKVSWPPSSALVSGLVSRALATTAYGTSSASPWSKAASTSEPFKASLGTRTCRLRPATPVTMISGPGLRLPCSARQR